MNPTRNHMPSLQYGYYFIVDVTRKMSAYAYERVSEECIIDGISVSIITIRIERVVPFEEHMMRSCHVGGVDAHFDPPLDAIDPTIVGIVVTYDTSCSGRPEDNHLVNVDGDIVFDQSFRRAAGKTDGVTGPPGTGHDLV